MKRAGLSTDVVARVFRMLPQLDDETALRWTMRLRQNGITDLSGLVERATSPLLPAHSRALSAALAIEAFQDEDAVPHLRAAAKEVPVEQMRELLLVVDEVAPSATPEVLRGLASSPQRTLALADLLEEFGALELAEAMREDARS